MPKVTIYMSCFNHQDFVAEAIESVLGQTFTDFEFLINDDASTDASVDIIRRYRDPRIRFSPLTRNVGVSVANNLCIAEARGEYIMTMSSDDVCLPDRLARQVAYLDAHPQVAAVFSRAEIINEASQPLQDPTHPYMSVFNQPDYGRREWLRHFFFLGNALCAPSAAVRAQVYQELGGFDARLAQLPDFDMWLRIALRHDIYVQQENLLRYRVRNLAVNASGARPDSTVRLYWETAKVLKHFLSLSPQAVAEIFPEAGQYVRTLDDLAVPYVLARMALDNNTGGQLATRLFGQEILFTLLDSQLGFDLPGRYGFTVLDLAQAAGPGTASLLTGNQAAHDYQQYLLSLLEQLSDSVEQGRKGLLPSSTYAE